MIKRDKNISAEDSLYVALGKEEGVELRPIHVDESVEQPERLDLDTFSEEKDKKRAKIYNSFIVPFDLGKRMYANNPAKAKYYLKKLREVLSSDIEIAKKAVEWLKEFKQQVKKQRSEW